MDSKPKEWMSPYVSMSDNPVSNVDPNGDYDRPKNGWQRLWNSWTNRSYLNKAYYNYQQHKASGAVVFYNVKDGVATVSVYHGYEVSGSNEKGVELKHNSYNYNFSSNATWITAEGGDKFVGAFNKEHWDGVDVVWQEKKPKGMVFPTYAMPDGMENPFEAAEFWTATKNATSVENAYNHWLKHGAEFPEYYNSKQYVEAATDFLHNPSESTLTKIRSNGDILRYNPETNTFGVMNASGTPRTMFRPENGMDYWLKQ